MTTATCFPALPSGYSAMAVWGFHDPAGFAYEFHRVYGPPQGGGERGAFSRLDEALSYWAVAFPTFGAGAGVHMTGRWMSYAEAQKLSRSRLTFRRFSSPVEMCEEVPGLLRVTNIPVQAPALP